MKVNVSLDPPKGHLDDAPEMCFFNLSLAISAAFSFESASRRKVFRDLEPKVAEHFYIPSLFFPGSRKESNLPIFL